MTRPAVKAGLPGPGQDVFPEQARELGRRMGLYSDEVVVLRHTAESSGGATRDTFAPETPIRGRIDPVGKVGRGGPMGDVMNESASHIVTMDAAVDVTERDRIAVQDSDWLILAVREVTDPLITRVEVRKA